MSETAEDPGRLAFLRQAIRSWDDWVVVTIVHAHEQSQSPAKFLYFTKELKDVCPQTETGMCVVSVSRPHPQVYHVYWTVTPQAKVPRWAMREFLESMGHSSEGLAGKEHVITLTDESPEGAIMFDILSRILAGIVSDDRPSGIGYN